MDVLLQGLGLVMSVGVLAYWQAPRYIWVPVMAAILVVLTYFTPWYSVLTSVAWLLYFLIVSYACCSALRSRFVIQKIFPKLKAYFPQISQTEREALAAGDTSWEAELFQGRPGWKTFFKRPKPTLTQAEESFLNNDVQTLCSMIDEWQLSQNDIAIPSSVWDYLKEKGFFGLVIKPEYGGKGFGAFAHSCIVAKIASHSPSLAVTVMVPNSLGPAELLQFYGTDEQKNHYLPRLATGEEIPCFALTGIESGSDAASMLDHGVVCYGQHEGKDVLGIRLTWNKRYITLAPVATLLGLAIQLYDPEQLLGDKEHIGITLCLIPTVHPGVEIGKRHIPMNLAFHNGPTSGKDVFIPLEWVIGGSERVGDGWKMLMECLAIGRGISLPSLSTAAALLCYRTTGAYAQIRQQFSLPIGRFEGIEEPLARIAGLTYLCEATRWFNAHLVDQALKPAIAAAIAKYHVTEMSRKVINDAMDIHGGRAVQLGPRNYLAIAYQSIPIGITVEGANILTRNLMIFGQGAIRCHPYIQQHITALNADDQKQFDRNLLAHVGYMVSNATRCLWHSLTAGRLIIVPKVAPKRAYCRQLTRMSTALAFVADVALSMLGGNLKRKERLSARLGDVLSYLYLASVSLLYFEQQERKKEDWPMVEWGLRYCLTQAQDALLAFFDNFPHRWVAKLLRRWVFFWGPCYRMANQDRLDHQIATQMMQPGESRDRLTHYCYVSPRDSDATGRMESALLSVLNTRDVEARLKQAIREQQLKPMFDPAIVWEEAIKKGMLTEEEHQQLQNNRRIVLDAIAVDEF